MQTGKRILVVLLLVLVAVCAGVALTWAPDRPVSELQARWAQPPSSFIKIMGMEVHYRDEGPRDDPEPIVLLHGTSSSLHTWDGWAAGLSGKRRVIRFDLPGFGLTGPDPAGDYTMQHYVDFVDVMMTALGVTRYVVGGNSLGGEIAWECAIANPARVRKLILVDAAGYVPAGSMPIGFRVAQWPGINKISKYVLPRSMIETSLKQVYGDPSKVTPELVDRYYELTLREGNRAAVSARFAQSNKGSDEKKISKVAVPTLIIWGGQDRLIPPATAEMFHNDIPGSWVVMFDQLGHVPQEEGPSQTLDAVRQFLKITP
ncbi:pimeloyl-ACP methyl ester carboxylesterase [Fluviicoccus keumensis]|uniref:Pimeloyl-ACP methyl ester carboxylesterase n=1 Tax=Fluviicoccus keumensis TaxID=1435465 RepID=A0A4Q7YJH8_9GAMM|nr:alpha/beta hydrolase [Fluviicoccus keumensis]RZU36933.1 pimeloyl-ACP methyl ester carboxylesterase [Fluviicoccus keumensis]